MQPCWEQFVGLSVARCFLTRFLAFATEFIRKLTVIWSAVMDSWPVHPTTEAQVPQPVYRQSVSLQSRSDCGNMRIHVIVPKVDFREQRKQIAKFFLDDVYQVFFLNALRRLLLLISAHAAEYSVSWRANIIFGCIWDTWIRRWNVMLSARPANEPSKNVIMQSPSVPLL